MISCKLCKYSLLSLSDNPCHSCAMLGGHSRFEHSDEGLISLAIGRQRFRIKVWDGMTLADIGSQTME